MGPPTAACAEAWAASMRAHQSGAGAQGQFEGIIRARRPGRVGHLQADGDRGPVTMNPDGSSSEAGATNSEKLRLRAFSLHAACLNPEMRPFARGSPSDVSRTCCLALKNTSCTTFRWKLCRTLSVPFVISLDA
jgi:hypothetical protein